MRVFKYILGLTLIILLFSCSNIKTEQEEEPLQPSKDLLAQFAFEARIYSLEGNQTPDEKIIKEVGKIEEITKDITKNGEGKSLNSNIELLPGTKIYTVKDVDKDTIVAVKINDIYYTAIFTRSLE